MGNCKDCAEKREHETVETIPYIVYQEEMYRYERREKWHIIAIIVAIAAMFLSNLIWLWCWMQYDYSSYSVSTDGGGDAYYNEQSGDGEIYNGTNPSTEKNAEE